MADVKLYGSSDDLIEVEGDIAGCDEYNSEDSHFVLTDYFGKQVRIRVWYTRRGIWAIAVAPTEEGGLMPEVYIDAHSNGYSAQAYIKQIKSVIHEVPHA